MFRLDGKTALVTGASRGMGRAIAVTMAKQGARIIVHYGNSKSEAEAVSAEIAAAGGHADLVGADLSNPEGVFSLAREVTRLAGTRLDIFVANAGAAKAGSMKDHTVEDFDRLFATNVRAPFFLLQQLQPILVDGSSVIITTSLAARVAPGSPGQPGTPSLPAYAATKGALETLVKHWAGLLGVDGIRVNAIAPGIIATEMSSFTKTEEGRNVALNLQALKRLGTAEDVADVVAFLASDGARWITGASIPVDGGSKL